MIRLNLKLVLLCAFADLSKQLRGIVRSSGFRPGDRSH